MTASSQSVKPSAPTALMNRTLRRRRQVPGRPRVRHGLPDDIRAAGGPGAAGWPPGRERTAALAAASELGRRLAGYDPLFDGIGWGALPPANPPPPPPPRDPP